MSKIIEVEEWKRALASYHALYVGVTPSLEILEKRERARGNRYLGSARGQYFKVHENIAYNLEIDTYKHSLEENVQKIKMALKEHSKNDQSYLRREELGLFSSSLFVASL